MLLEKEKKHNLMNPTNLAIHHFKQLFQNRKNIFQFQKLKKTLTKKKYDIFYFILFLIVIYYL